MLFSSFVVNLYIFFFKEDLSRQNTYIHRHIDTIQIITDIFKLSNYNNYKKKMLICSNQSLDLN